MTDEEFVFGGDATDIPPGEYPATCSALATKPGKFGDFRAWDFTTDEGHKIGGASSMFTGPKSKGGRWAMALLGRKPASGEKVTLIGLPCRIVVGLNKDDWPEVTDVLPPLAKGKAPKTPAAHVAEMVDTIEARTDDDALPF